MDIVMRIAFVYVALTLAFRALGKRELSQLSPFELVTLLMIAEIVAPALTAGDESLTGGAFRRCNIALLSLDQFGADLHVARIPQIRGSTADSTRAPRTVD